jgi:multiple sugar transport system permease protein
VSGASLFVLGTAASWTGLLLLGAFLYNALRLALRVPGLDRQRLLVAVSGSAVAGALLLAGSSRLLQLEQMAGPVWRLPIIWFVMPFTAWAALTCGAMALVRGGQSWLAISPEERRARLGSAAVWLATGVVCFALLKRSEDSTEVLRGAVQLSPSTGIGLLMLACGTLAAMAFSGRWAVARGWARATASHAALLVGSLIFALPFAWLMITSFKEDRDMSSPDGIVWVPKVQETVSFLDPDDPLMQGTFQGRTVQGSILERRPDGTVKIDITRPATFRGLTFESPLDDLKEIPKEIPVVSGDYEGTPVQGMVVREQEDGTRRVSILEPAHLKGVEFVRPPAELEPVRHVGLRWQNYRDALEYLPAETLMGLVYLKNTLIITILSVIGTLLSSAVVAYAFSRLRFPGKTVLFTILLSTMMLPAAVTLLPTFLIFRGLGWIDTLLPLWVPAFFGSAFNIFLLRQFFLSIPMELEDASKIDGCSYLRTFWSVMLPQIKPALAVIAIWTFMGAWNNFMGPLIYINSPENMPIAYAVQLFQGDRGGEPGLLTAFTTMAILPVLALFFFAQRYFIEGVTLSGLGGR